MKALSGQGALALGDEMIPVLFIGELLSDANIVLKIFVLLTIVSFFVNHLGKTPISIVLIVGVSYFVLFDLWVLFGGIYLIWMLLMFGVAGIIIDFFFVGAFSGQKQEEGPVSSGADLMKRQEALEAARRNLSGQFRKRFGR